MGRKLEYPPPPSPGLKRLVPNYYFAFSCCPVGAVLKFPCGGGGTAVAMQV